MGPGGGSRVTLGNLPDEVTKGLTMPNEITAPTATAPAERMSLAVDEVRGAQASTGTCYACVCLADGVETSAMGHASPPGWCFADES